MPPARPPATLVYNPNAGRRRHARTIDGIKAALETRYQLAIVPSEGPQSAIALARAAARGGAEAVFAWGGDGTVREVVEGILGSPVVLGVLPGGTFNVVAKAIGLPGDPVRAAAALTTATPKARDVGLIGDTPFLMQAIAGLEGFIMHHLRAEMKARLGYAGASFDALRAFSRYRFEPFTVEVDGATYEVTGASFVNMTEYALQYHFVPGARWDDGRAHVLLYTGRTHLSALMFSLGIALGRHHRRADVLIREATSMTIHAGPSVHVQTDGDPWKGPLPTTCRLSPDRIQVLIPR
jgi:diacylglycerol kinase family enzyme